LDKSGEFSWEIRSSVAATLEVYVSDEKLKYLRENEVIRSLGDVPHPSGKGRTCLYASGSSQQVTRLMQLTAEDRILSRAARAVWLENFPVGQKWTREPIMHAAQEWDTALAVVKRNMFLGDDQAALSDLTLEWLETNPRFYARTFRLVRRLVGSKRLPTFVFHMLRLALGKTLPIPRTSAVGATDMSEADDEELTVVVTGLGFDRMTKDRILDSVPGTKTEILVALNKVASRLLNSSLADRIVAATDEVLLRAAREVEAVRANNQLVFNLLVGTLGRHALGRGHATRIFGSYNDHDTAILTALWVVVRGSFIPEAAAELEIHSRLATLDHVCRGG